MVTPKTTTTHDMLVGSQELIRREIGDGIGADINVETDSSGVQAALRIWFADLRRACSPIVELRPAGLNRYAVRLTFGNFAAETIAQMKRAGAEDVQLARALVRSIEKSARVSFSDGLTTENWTVSGAGFSITAEKRGIENRFGDESVIRVCREIVIPILGAMAELYGYDVVEDDDTRDIASAVEGAVKLSVIHRRERNPRNRLLCLRLHGDHCVVCGRAPREIYGEAGSIIEVHHLQPLSLAGEGAAYSPETDLVPVCPSCHRALHTKRPVPWSPSELKSIMAGND